MSKLIVAILLVVAAAPVSGAELKATFIGNSGFHLTDGTSAILVDFPYESGAFGYMTWSAAAVPRGPKPLCLFTHAHADHLAPDLVAQHCAVVVGAPEVTRRVPTTTIAFADPIVWQGLVFGPVATPCSRATLDLGIPFAAARALSAR